MCSFCLLCFCQQHTQYCGGCQCSIQLYNVSIPRCWYPLRQLRSIFELSVGVVEIEEKPHQISFQHGNCILKVKYALKMSYIGTIYEHKARSRKTAKNPPVTFPTIGTYCTPSICKISSSFTFLNDATLTIVVCG